MKSYSNKMPKNNKKYSKVSQQVAPKGTQEAPKAPQEPPKVIEKPSTTQTVTFTATSKGWKDAPKPQVINENVSPIPSVEEWEKFIDELTAVSKVFNIIYSGIDQFQGKTFTLSQFEESDMLLKFREYRQTLDIVAQMCNDESIQSIDIQQMTKIIKNAERFIEEMTQKRKDHESFLSNTYVKKCMERDAMLHKMISEAIKKEQNPKISWADLTDEEEERRKNLLALPSNSKKITDIAQILEKSKTETKADTIEIETRVREKYEAEFRKKISDSLTITFPAVKSL
jgi:hypothetical protein